MSLTSRDESRTFLYMINAIIIINFGNVNCACQNFKQLARLLPAHCTYAMWYHILKEREREGKRQRVH